MAFEVDFNNNFVNEELMSKDHDRNHTSKGTNSSLTDDHDHNRVHDHDHDDGDDNASCGSGSEVSPEPAKPDDREFNENRVKNLIQSRRRTETADTNRCGAAGAGHHKSATTTTTTTTISSRKQTPRRHKSSDGMLQGTAAKSPHRRNRSPVRPSKNSPSTPEGALQTRSAHGVLQPCRNDTARHNPAPSSNNDRRRQMMAAHNNNLNHSHDATEDASKDRRRQMMKRAASLRNSQMRLHIESESESEEESEEQEPSEHNTSEDEQHAVSFNVLQQAARKRMGIKPQQQRTGPGVSPGGGMDRRAMMKKSQSCRQMTRQTRRSSLAESRGSSLTKMSHNHTDSPHQQHHSSHREPRSGGGAGGGRSRSSRNLMAGLEDDDDKEERRRHREPRIGGGSCGGAVVGGGRSRSSRNLMAGLEDDDAHEKEKERRNRDRSTNGAARSRSSRNLMSGLEDEDEDYDDKGQRRRNRRIRDHEPSTGGRSRSSRHLMAGLEDEDDDNNDKDKDKDRHRHHRRGPSDLIPTTPTRGDRRNARPRSRSRSTRNLMAGLEDDEPQDYDDHHDQALSPKLDRRTNLRRSGGSDHNKDKDKDKDKEQKLQRMKERSQEFQHATKEMKSAVQQKTSSTPIKRSPTSQQRQQLVRGDSESSYHEEQLQDCDNSKSNNNSKTFGGSINGGSKTLRGIGNLCTNLNDSSAGAAAAAGGNGGGKTLLGIGNLMGNTSSGGGVGGCKMVVDTDNADDHSVKSSDSNSRSITPQKDRTTDMEMKASKLRELANRAKASNAIHHKHNTMTPAYLSKDIPLLQSEVAKA